MDDEFEQLQSPLNHDQYIKEFNLNKIFEDLLHNVVGNKPKHPIIFMIKYLSGLLIESERQEAGIIIPEPFPRYKNFTSLKSNTSNSIFNQKMTKELRTEYKRTETLYGGDLVTMAKLSEKCPTDKIGFILTDGDCLFKFKKISAPIISHIHKINITPDEIGEYQDDKVDQNGKSVMKEFYYNTELKQLTNNSFLNLSNTIHAFSAIQFSISRNVFEAPFMAIISRKRLNSLEEDLKTIINNLIRDREIIELKHYSYLDNMQECRNILSSFGYNLHYLTDAGIKGNWPYNRSIYTNETNTIIILINFANHLEVISVNKTQLSIEQIVLDYQTIINIINKIEDHIAFESSKQFGYLTTNPAHIGAGMTITTTIKLNHFHKKIIKGGSLTGLVDSLNGHTIIENGECNLTTVNYYTLNHQSEIDFIERTFIQLTGLIVYDKSIPEKTEASFTKYELKNNTKDCSLQKAYESTFPMYQYSFTSYGNTINNIFAFYLNDHMNPFGILLKDKSEYNTYREFIYKYIATTQNYNIETMNHIHKPETYNPVEISLDNKKKITGIYICLIRNLDLPFALSQYNHNEEAEKMIIDTLTELNKKMHYGDYYSLANDDKKEAYKIIESNNLMIFHRDDMLRFQMDIDFPKNRGVIKFQNENIFALINDVDHIKFYLSLKAPIESLNRQIIKLLTIEKDFSKYLKFLYDKKFGFLTSSPRFIGTGLLAKLHIKQEKLTNEKITEVFKNKEFVWSTLRKQTKGEPIVEIINRYTIGISETEILSKLLSYFNQLFTLEDRLTKKPSLALQKKKY